jgi:hypothetical protein
MLFICISSFLICPIALANGLEQPLVTHFPMDFNGSYPGSKNKKPVILYLAVDTAEPFMRIAIDKEVSDLKKLCISKPQTNAAIIISSQLNQSFIQKKPSSIQICQNGVIERRRLDFPKQSQSNFINSQSTPLAQPQIFEAVMNNLIENIFPVKTYSYFVQVKSHGNKNWLVVYNHETAIQNSITKQYSMLKHFNSRSNDITKSKLGDGQLATYFDALKDEFEGKITSKKGIEFRTSSIQNILPEKNLGGDEGRSRGGLGQSVSAKGGQPMGFTEIEAYEIFKRLQTKYKAEFGLVFFEACNKSSSDTISQHRNAKEEAAYEFFHYSSTFFRGTGNLSYHNFTWLDLADYVNRPDRLYYGMLSLITDISNKFPIDELYATVIKNDLPQFKQFIDSGFDVDSISYEKNPLVSFLLRTGRIEFLDYLLAKYPNHLSDLAKNKKIDLVAEILAIENPTLADKMLKRLPDYYKLQKGSLKQSKFSISSIDDIQFLKLFSMRQNISKDQALDQETFSFLLKESGITKDTLFEIKPLKSLRPLHLNLLEVTNFGNSAQREIVELILMNGFHIRDTVDSKWKILIEFIDNLYPLNDIKAIAQTVESELTADVATELLNHVDYSAPERLLGRQIIYFLNSKYKALLKLENFKPVDEGLNYNPDDAKWNSLNSDKFYFALEAPDYFKLDEKTIETVKEILTKYECDIPISGLNDYNCEQEKKALLPARSSTTELKIIESIIFDKFETARLLIVKYLKRDDVNRKFLRDLQNYVIYIKLIMKAEKQSLTKLFSRSESASMPKSPDPNLIDSLVDLLFVTKYDVSDYSVCTAIAYGDFKLLDRLFSIKGHFEVDLTHPLLIFAQNNDSEKSWKKILSYKLNFANIHFLENECYDLPINFRKFLFGSKQFTESLNSINSFQVAAKCPTDDITGHLLLNLSLHIDQQGQSENYCLTNNIETFLARTNAMTNSNEFISAGLIDSLQSQLGKHKLYSTVSHPSLNNTLTFLKRLNHKNSGSLVHQAKSRGVNLLNAVLCNQPSMAILSGFSNNAAVKTTEWLTLLLAAEDSTTLSSEYAMPASNQYDRPDINTVLSCLFRSPDNSYVSPNYQFSDLIGALQGTSKNSDKFPFWYNTELNDLFYQTQRTSEINQQIANVKLLTKHSPSLLTVRDSDGRTYLHWAAYLGNWALFKGLIESGADVNAVDQSGNSVLDYVFKGKILSLSMLKLLNKYGFLFKEKNQTSYLEKLKSIPKKELVGFKVVRPNKTIHSPVLNNLPAFNGFFTPESQLEAFQTFWSLYLWAL